MVEIVGMIGLLGFSESKNAKNCRQGNHLFIYVGYHFAIISQVSDCIFCYSFGWSLAPAKIFRNNMAARRSLDSIVQPAMCGDKITWGNSYN